MFSVLELWGIDMVIFYSAEYNSFFPLPLKSDYEKAGTWPGDAKEIDLGDYLKYIGEPPEGKTLGSKNGMPAWVDS